MLSADVVVAGGGVAGLLIAGELALRHSVILLEQSNEVPRNKYWLTDGKSAKAAPTLADCVDTRYDFLDFISSDRLIARVAGQYCLWDTSRLVERLTERLLGLGARLLTGHRLYSIRHSKDAVTIYANTETIRTRLLVDCMGFGSPLVGAKNVVDILGYYILHGCEVQLTGDISPVALDNVVLGRRPMYFELFPTSRGTAHAAIILPSQYHRPDMSLRSELHFILTKSHYSGQIRMNKDARTYFGIVPVGRLRKAALDRIVFFGEAGQVNPAASATGLSRMLRTRCLLAESLHLCLQSDRLRRTDLIEALPPTMTRMNRVFQECLFESILSYDSDGFRRLVADLNSIADQTISDLVFADFDFRGRGVLPLLLRAALQPRGVFGRNLLQAALRYCSRGGLR